MCVCVCVCVFVCTRALCATGFINNYTPRAIVDITLREGSNMFEAEWLDLDPVWILEGYEVVFFRGENVIPEKVFVVPVTEVRDCVLCAWSVDRVFSMESSLHSCSHVIRMF